jgi:hypothetical protein
MESCQSDDPQWFLMALNGASTFFPPFVARERVIDAFLTHLRLLADEWIATARDADGVAEEPCNRRLTRGLKRRLSFWAAANKPDFFFDTSGELVLLLPVCKLNFKGEGVLIEPREAAEQEAVRRFVFFLDSPYRYRLCKCLSCGEYYYTERQPQDGPKGLIKYGTYCPRHRHVASAKRANEQRRGPAQERRLEIAAKWWGRWPNEVDGDPGKQAEWVARKVNAEANPQWTPIARNWVTRHRAEIERRSRQLRRGSGAAKGARNAQSKRT